MLQDYRAFDITEPGDIKDDTAQYFRIFGEEVKEAKPFINIGAGDWRHPLWQNIDHVTPPYDQYTLPEFNIDLGRMDPWPIDDGTIRLLFCSHTMEHLDDEVANYVLREAARVLADGGIFRIVVPDIELAYYAYLLNDNAFYDYRNAGKPVQGKVTLASTLGHSKGLPIEMSFLARFGSVLGRPATWKGKSIREALDEAFVAGDIDSGCKSFLKEARFRGKNPRTHINFYTSDRLRNMMLEAGFDGAVRTGYGQSLSPLMRNKFYFDRTRPSESLYVDGIKL